MKLLVVTSKYLIVYLTRFRYIRICQINVTSLLMIGSQFDFESLQLIENQFDSELTLLSQFDITLPFLISLVIDIPRL